MVALSLDYMKRTSVFKKIASKLEKSANKKAEKEKIEKELEILKRRIEPSIMDRYMQMREDKKFPILVPLVNNSCGGCAMALPNARLDLLKKDGVLECENCHRIIYINE